MSWTRVGVSLVLVLAAAAFADRWKSFGDRQYRSPNGKHALFVVKSKAFELMADKAIVAKGELRQLPLEAHVLDGAPGAVLFEKYANLGYGDVLSRLDAGGNQPWAIKLADLFDPATVKQFRHSVSSIWWKRAWWVDESRKKIVLVAQGGLVREVDLETGAVAKDTRKSVLLTGFALPHARMAALELAIELRVKGALLEAAALRADEKQPLAVRARAALAAQMDGGPAAEAELLTVALAEKQPSTQRSMLIGLVARVLGADAVDLLEKVAERKEATWDAVRALGKLGAPGARGLAGIIVSGDRSARNYAAKELGKLPADAVGKAVGNQIADADANVAGALIRAGIDAGVKDLGKIVQPHQQVVISVLERESAPIEWLADHFRSHPTTEAVQPLLRSLTRHARDPTRKEKLLAALRSCTGLDFGDDPAAWRKALGR